MAGRTFPHQDECCGISVGFVPLCFLPHPLGNLGFVLIRTRFVLRTRGNLSESPHISQWDAFFRGSLWSSPRGLGGLHRWGGCNTPSPHGEAAGQVSCRSSWAPSLRGCQRPVLMEPGRKMKGGHISWGNGPTPLSALEEILVASPQASFSLVQPHHPPGGTLL